MRAWSSQRAAKEANVVMSDLRRACYKNMREWSIVNEQRKVYKGGHLVVRVR